MTSVRRALLFSLLERYALTVLAFASNVLLARLLTPSEIGVYSVCMAVVGIAGVLREFGIGSYLIQKREVTRAHLGTAFGLSLVMGVLLFAVLFLAAGPVARFYGDDRLVLVTQVVAVNFLTLPFCTISMAMLRREMRFKAVLWANVIAAAAGFVVTVGGALLGWGALSMAVGSIVTNLVVGFCTWWVRRADGWVRPVFSEWRDVLHFGGQTTLSNTVGTIAMNANDLVVGRLLGLDAVAMISRAMGLMNLYHRDLMAAVRNVALPGFAAGAREGADVAAAELRAVSVITVVGWSFYAFVSVFALDVVRLLFGDQWDSAAPLVPLFCLGGAIAALNAVTPQRLIATGHVGVVTRLELLIHPLRIVVILGALVVWPEMSTVAWVFIGSAVFGVLLYRRAVHRLAPMSLRRYLGMLMRSAAVAAAFVLPALLVRLLLGAAEGEHGVPVLTACAVGGAMLAMLTGYMVRHPLLEEPWVQGLMRRLPVSAAGR